MRFAINTPPLESGDRLFRSETDWFQLQEGQYVLLQPDEQGVVRSQIFPGLWLSPNALYQRNRSELLSVLQAGLATPAHQEFVERLNLD